MSFQTNLIPNSRVLTFTGINREIKSIPPQLNQLPQVEMQQVHKNQVTECKEDKSYCVLQADAIFTTLPNLVLKVKHADCLPILVVAELKANTHSPHSTTQSPKAIAVIHAGRKSTEQKITNKVCQTLKNKFQIKQINFWLGPCICDDCYQINKETNKHYDLRAENLKQISSQFSNAQYTTHNFNECTCHQADKYFSYRREGKQVKMNWSGILLKTPG